MNRYLNCALLLVTLCLFSVAFAQKQESATVEFANRPIVTLRATVQELGPIGRAARVEERLRKLSDEDLASPIVQSSISLENRDGVLFTIGTHTIFVLSKADLESDNTQSLEKAAEEVAKNLTAAIAAVREQHKPTVIFYGLLRAAVATAIALLLLWIIKVFIKKFHLLTKKRFTQVDRQSNLKIGRYAYSIVARLITVALIILWLLIGDLWLTNVLKGFPLTKPIGERLTRFVFDIFASFGRAIVDAIPNIVTVVIILFLTRALYQVLKIIFKNIEDGSTVIPGLHRDTIQATRRITGVLVWVFGIAIAYPYIPLANSDSFKGLSVMFGFMLTLGSAGIVNQLMSGLVLIYSRALRVDDFVHVGDDMGVVKEMNILSTKIVNMRNEEITIPNALLVSKSIKNYTNMSLEKNTMISTKVSIGYNHPWRQIHMLLCNAALNTSGVRQAPEPFVIQNSLADFYVQYELYAYVDRPLNRVTILSELHASIQDQFNAHEIQIMSPHFMTQPVDDVLVPKDKWSVSS
jgi:small-conductance mechanosensitive channel